MPENWQIGGFGLYIHWPFCAAKCPYCDFNSHVVTQIDQKAWKQAYLAEITRVSLETSDRVLTSVFFGGGTPSLMDPDVVAAIIDAIHAKWTVANDLEITLEANPTSVEAGRFAGYRQAGVNRVSLGVQALNDSDLRALGRLHSVSEAMQALEIARNEFSRISFDLIYARQEQDLADWGTELRHALALEPDHLSLYQLTIEGGTAFGDRYDRGLLRGLPTEDLGADMYLLTQELCENSGLPAYEVSNHAKVGLESRHNLIYWRGGDYVGIGPGAHGRLTFGGQRFATETALAPVKWLQQVNSTGSGELSRTLLNSAEVDSECLMMGLRIVEGIDLGRLSDIDLYTKKVSYLQDLGLLERQGDQIMATSTGRPILNALVRELMPD